MSDRHCRREKIIPGGIVDIVLKEDQRTGKLTRGIVKDLLTNKGFHPRGIKVRLTNGQVGRVQHILSLEEIASVTEEGTEI